MFLPKVVAVSFLFTAGTSAFAYENVYEQGLYARGGYPKPSPNYYVARDAYPEPYEHADIYARAAYLEDVIDSHLSRRAAEADAYADAEPVETYVDVVAKARNPGKSKPKADSNTPSLAPDPRARVKAKAAQQQAALEAARRANGE